LVVGLLVVCNKGRVHRLSKGDLKET
jgi:hypothetical protein